MSAKQAKHLPLVGIPEDPQRRHGQTIRAGRPQGSNGSNGGGGDGKPAKLVPSHPIEFQAPGEVSLDRWQNNDLMADLTTFMRLYGYTGAVTFDRRVSEKTYTNRKMVMQSTLKMLRRRVPQFRTLSQLRLKQRDVIFAYWNEKLDGGETRLATSTQVNNWSVLVWFWKVCGVNAPPIQEACSDPLIAPTLVRRSVATKDKSWSGNGVDFDVMYEAAQKIDPVVARLLYLQYHYGLRLRESLRLQPHEDDKGNHLAVTRGPKGGRPREINYADFGDDGFKQALEDVKKVLSPGEHAAWKGRVRDLKQARERFYYVLRQLGLTKKGLGVTAHGLRCEFANRMYEFLTGEDSPIRGGASTDWSKVLPHRRTLTRALGHNRVSVTSAYLGSWSMMSRVAQERFSASWSVLAPLLPTLRTMAEAYGIENIWWVGSRVNGSNASLGADYEFLLDDAVPAETASKASRAIGPMLEEALKHTVVMRVAAVATIGEKQRWASNALPLYDVEPPRLDGVDDVSWGSSAPKFAASAPTDQRAQP